MLFNSVHFLIFLPIVFILYWFAFGRNMRLQNVLVVVASYVFYGWWDWRFLILIAFTSLWSWVFGVLDMGHARGRGFRLALSCVINLGILGFFKYYNFFIDQTTVLLESFGIQANPTSLNIILPVGISFYTFQALSYTIDVYRKQIEPTRDPIAFLAFVSFFPQLVAGPIERATNLLPQFLRPRIFDYGKAVDGCRQMLWGFFKKMVVADNCANVANTVLNNWEAMSGFSILTGMFCFSIQIYGDFSGYSDIAIGCSRLFGIDLRRNFAYPYFSRDIAEFWRRWHISLTTWFRDYVYIPIGGSRCSRWKQVRNTFVVFLVSGFWHGANWTFIAWGAFHAACFLPLLLSSRNRRHTGDIERKRWLPGPKELAMIVSTFVLVLAGWLLFRAPDIMTALTWGRMILVESGPLRSLLTSGFGGTILLFIGIMFLVEWINRLYQYGLERLPKNRLLRWLVYVILANMIIVYRGAQEAFIYFQF